PLPRPRPRRDRDRDLALDRARDLDCTKIFKDVNLKSLVAKLEALRAQTSNRRLSRQETFKLSRDVWKLWLDALHLDSELVNLSEAEVETLTTYLNANLLLVQCRQSAVRVSTAARKALEAQMLRA
ncbi:MAG: hypothetical protein HC879_10620, partial [Leptolyngbyaceae cyanobacterium SL_5_9]|nr:hypothetical protein [Leptolyngbyaceae cyanobacterium SL_5_9]